MGNMKDAALAAGMNLTELERWLDQRLEQKLLEQQQNHTPSLAIIATKGALDMAYPPFILASTAGALGWDVSVFFTFYGLELLKRDLNLGLSPLGNPAMPMKLPLGPAWLKAIDWPIPNTLQCNLPGYEAFAGAMMRKSLARKGVASIEELREASLEAGARLTACQMTVDLFGYEREEFIPEVTEWIGAASYLPISAAADVSLFI